MRISRSWVTKRAQNGQPRIAPLSEPKVFVPQPYAVADASSPFDRQKLTLVLRRDSQQNASNKALLEAEQNRRKQELESYPLDAITMVGSMQQNGGQTALVRVDPADISSQTRWLYGGKTMAVSEKNYRKQHSTAWEIVQDPAGDWVEGYAAGVTRKEG